MTSKPASSTTERTLLHVSVAKHTKEQTVMEMKEEKIFKGVLGLFFHIT